MPGTPNGHQIAERAACPRGRPQFGLWAVLLAFLAALAGVNPLRECPRIDDWAFAATVWHWLDTGQYRLNEVDRRQSPLSNRVGRSVLPLVWRLVCRPADFDDRPGARRIGGVSRPGGSSTG